ncbi:MAG: ribosome-binding factor A [Candidatus Phytoplasma cynodontis]|uniref:30S ribosome-binding factor RbfA n=1 Tax='Cynodon dactylon' phytoplasma TaxID=295320 RepID=UPI001265B547|nr:30S ribosome-binding factor RbfA ['Cynodon dactylon' phytoplasma]KAB8122114.1 30S ribosome-binding factor RbfA ['Cynodon dactylon' phytoplasma]WIA07878.1 MAG: ribosome-binding factor A [Candidatus Phytoplasma cynodontis]
MKNISIQRRTSLIKELMVGIINNVIQNDQIGHISITDVELSNDLSFSTIYYTILKDSKENLLLVANLIKENKKRIRSQLANELKQIKKIPDLIFKYDRSYEEGAKIDKILKDLKE